MTVSAVRTAELADALTLLYGPDAPDLSARVAHGFRLVARGELNPDDLLVARADERVIGAVYARRLPGAIAVVWPPRAADSHPAVEDALVSAALGHVAGVRVVQAFLSPDEMGRSAALCRGGFRHVTTVWEMQLAPTTGPSYENRHPTLASRPTLLPYAVADADQFHSTLLSAHDDSLDCPELNGSRTPDEVLAGYHDSAPDTARWWLARWDGEPVGVLLLCGTELAFVGVRPEYRGRGIGRELVAAACRLAPELALIVDIRNVPACRLYQQAGLTAVGSREVFLNFPDPPADKTSASAFRL